MLIHRLARPLVAGALLVDAGCALRFQGELDGEPIPSFSTAAFAVVEGTGTSASVVALATPGDSCAEATAWAGLRADRAEATTPERQQAVADDQLAWQERVLPEGAWVVQLQVDTDGRALLRDVSVDLGGTDNDADVALSLCRSEGNPRAEGGVFIADVDCSRAREGDLRLALDEEAGSLRVEATKDAITFTDDAGRADGALRLDMTFSACPSLATALQGLGGAFFDLGTGAVDGGDGADCREACFTDETGVTRCEVFCDDG